MSQSHAVIYGGTAGQVTLQSLPTPVPGNGEILVRVLGCTLCGSDLHSFEGRRTVPVPTILGHEIVGEVVALGSAAPQWDLAGQPITVGSRATWAIVAHCGDCFYCLRDLPQKCLRAVKYGHEPLRPGYELLGGLAEHCLLVAGTSLVTLPPDLPMSVACPASCATATVAAALESAGELRDRSVCVLGAGMLGLNACAMASTRGAATVVCVDQQSIRCQQALEFGATRATSPQDLAAVRTELGLTHGFDVILELTGSPAAFEAAWPHARIGGVIVCVGSVFPSAPVPLALEQLVRRQLTLRGIHNYAPRHLLQAVEFLTATQDRFPWAGLVSQWLPLTECQSALELGQTSGAIRIGIRNEV